MSKKILTSLTFVFIVLLSGLSFATIINYIPSSALDTSGLASNKPAYQLTLQDLRKISESDNTYYNSTERWFQHYFNDSLYIEFNFSANLPADVIIQKVKLYFEWHQDNCHNILGARLKLWNGTNWNILNLNLSGSEIDKTEIIDLTNILNTSEKINNFRIQFQAHDYGGGGYTYHDLVKLEVEYTTCEEIAVKDTCNLYQDKCKWCEECSDHKVNSWHEGRCVNKSVDCGYHCEKGYCGAECESCGDCPNKCVGNVWNYNGTCTDNCLCSYLTENCDSYDGWYNTTETRWVETTGICKEKEQLKQVYRDYYCSNGCNYSITNERWIDTGNKRNCDTEKPVTTKIVGDPKIQGDGFTWITKNTKISLKCEDNFENVTLYWAYKVDDGDWTKFNLSNNSKTVYVEFSFPEDSNHTLQYYCEDVVGNKEQLHEQYYKVDTEAPETNKTYGAPFYSFGGKDYITSSTKISLTSTDKGCSGGVGLDKIFYKINDGNWTIYSQPFTIQQEGEHRICFKAKDKLGNEETEKCQNVTVDNTPPTTEKSLGNPKCEPQTCNINCYTINSSTQISLSANDVLAGVNKTYYRYCSGTSECNTSWTEYTTPFNIIGLPDGYVRIEYYSIDNAGNKEDIKYEINYLDNTKPVTKITSPFNITKTVTNFTIFVEDIDHCVSECYYSICNETNCTDFMTRQCNSTLTFNLCNFINCSLCEEAPKNITIKAYAKDCLGQEGNITSQKYLIEVVVHPEEQILLNPYNTPLIPMFVDKWYYFFLPKRMLIDAGITNLSIQNVLASIDGQYEVIFYYNGTEWQSFDPTRPEFLNTLKTFEDDKSLPYYIKMK